MSLPRVVVEPIVRAALLEDLGRAGDLTTEATVPAGLTGSVALVARDPGVIAGLPAATLAWRLLDDEVRVEALRPDGSTVAPGDEIALIHGPAGTLLTGERVALNLLGHLSGVATATAGLVAAVAGTHARICCTRKTTPGLRALEKEAVRAGGGSNHRFGLDDAVLIKDNHLAFAGGVTQALSGVAERVGHLVKVEIEVDTLDQLRAVLAARESGLRVDAVLLDNMTPALLAEAVALVDGRCVTEASGRITPATAGPIARAGVDLISAGWITHSAPVLDIGLDYRPTGAAGPNPGR
ncbi:nicotinate-nucleotide pyrophosphorylase (carboxylating) [Kineosphaera limosa]|uniref:Nicotinate-nucleotide pyrophosphorylase [carboxylating] n=1 Tax=Kineosphaera limosa NBRC 100340 TaxID=1184609 RepID=K6X6E6_9MICO|nr:carboxylating nicotinate-nucleotide diphosphorylase [Kineosphaera limosa]NYE02933.1 nicotinate-nucleotide pyrophosphorylase (carboxylating) [Kineosphaera limosa]GAB94364.1 nicotinate-nucleotide pyrophosphorylase [Kineosphaera limosa NBRC 100340]